MRLAERFGEPDVDAFMERVGPDQFMEWAWFDDLEKEERKRNQAAANVQDRMAQRVGG